MRNPWSKRLDRHARRARSGILAAVIMFVASVGAVALPATPAGAATCPPHLNGTWIGTWNQAYTDLSGSYEFTEYGGIGPNGENVGHLTSRQGSTVRANNVQFTGTDNCAVRDFQLAFSPFLHLVGTVSADGTRISGEWQEQSGSYPAGEWSAGLVQRTAVGVGSMDSDTGNDGATPANPLEVTVTGPSNEEMAALMANADGYPFTNFGNLKSYVSLDPVVVIAGYPTDEILVSTFELDASIARGVGAGNIGVNSNGAFIGLCSPFIDYPCVADRTDLPGGDARLTVWARSGEDVYSFSTYSNPKPEFFAGSSSIAEGSSATAGLVRTLQIPITLSSPLATTAKVHYSLRAGTADSSDYTPKSGTLTFLAGATRKVVAVKLTPDDVAEGNETFQIVLDTPVGAAIGRHLATQTIIADEGTSPNLIVGDATIAEGDSGVARVAKIPLHLSQPLAVDTDVSYSIYNSDPTSATVGAARKVRFLAGQVSKLITVKVIPNTIHFPGSEAWCAGGNYVELFVSPSTAPVTVSKSVGFLSICDDD